MGIAEVSKIRDLILTPGWVEHVDHDKMISAIQNKLTALYGGKHGLKFVYPNVRYFYEPNKELINFLNSAAIRDHYLNGAHFDVAELLAQLNDYLNMPMIVDNFDNEEDRNKFEHEIFEISLIRGDEALQEAVREVFKANALSLSQITVMYSCLEELKNVAQKYVPDSPHTQKLVELFDQFPFEKLDDYRKDDYTLEQKKAFVDGFHGIRKKIIRKFINEFNDLRPPALVRLKKTQSFPKLK